MARKRNNLFVIARNAAGSDLDAPLYSGSNPENLLTDLFAALLMVCQPFATKLFEALTGTTASQIWAQPQPSFERLEARTEFGTSMPAPDLRLDADNNVTLLVEVKVDAPLRTGQLEDYLHLAKREQSATSSVHLVALLARPGTCKDSTLRTDDNYRAPDGANEFSWSWLYQFVQSYLDKTKATESFTDSSVHLLNMFLEGLRDGWGLIASRLDSYPALLDVDKSEERDSQRRSFFGEYDLASSSYCRRGWKTQRADSGLELYAKRSGIQATFRPVLATPFGWKGPCMKTKITYQRQTEATRFCLLEPLDIYGDSVGVALRRVSMGRDTYDEMCFDVQRWLNDPLMQPTLSRVLEHCAHRVMEYVDEVSPAR